MKFMYYLCCINIIDMNTFLIIVGIICLAVQIPVWIVYFLHKKEIDAKADEEMRKKYPDWPYVERPKTHFASFPLSLWNDPD